MNKIIYTIPFLFSLTITSVSAAPVLYTDRITFLSDTRITTTVDINFDNFAAGTDLTNQSILGLTFNAPNASPLMVIEGSTGVRNPMSPSSGLNVLSPGGSNANIENDDLSLVFESPVQAFGLDVVFDVPDGASYVGVSFFDAFDNLIASNNSIPAPRGAPGFQFIGLVTDELLISRVLFDEFDPTASDDNVAYDSIIFTSPVPAPAAIWLFGSALIGLIGVAQRK